MNKKYSLWVTVTVAVLTAIITFQITFIAVDGKYDRAAKNEPEAVRKLYEIMSIYRDGYIGELDESGVAEAVADAYVASVDKYGSYMTADEYAAMRMDYGAQLVGIGVHVIYAADTGGIEIMNVMPESPAEKAELVPGDVITAVDGEAVADLGYYPAIDRIKGTVGTTVKLTVARGGSVFDVTVMRDMVTEQTVLHHVTTTDASIGYVRILSFDSGTPDQFISAVEELRALGCSSLVIDVRGNPGGLLDSVVKILDYILPEGPIVRLVDNKGQTQTISSDADCLDMKMAIVCNGSTASAGELFTSAIKDYERAVVVGTVTYGKGTVQSILALPDGDALSYSYKLYSPPYSDNYEGVGITPDIVIEQEPDVAGINIYKLSETEDTQLRSAIEELRRG